MKGKMAKDSGKHDRVKCFLLSSSASFRILMLTKLVGADTRERNGKPKVGVMGAHGEDGFGTRASDKKRKKQANAELMMFMFVLRGKKKLSHLLYCFVFYI